MRTQEQVQSIQEGVSIDWQQLEVRLALGMEEPIVIRVLLPSGYLIVADEQDHRYYPQRESSTGGSNIFATSNEVCYTPISFAEDELERAMLLCDMDALSPRTASWGSIIYTQEELAVIMGQSNIVIEAQVQV